MKYGLPQISEEEFNRFHQFVLAVFDQGRQRFSPELVAISTDTEGFPELHQPYLAKCDSLGVTMEDRGDYQERFHIWITPAYKEPMFKFYMTLAHELVHGYAGLKYSHNSHWRRWFYRVMWHLNESKFIPEPESPLNIVLWGQGLNYNRGVGEFDLVHEAFAKAESEHEQVVKNYWERISIA